MRDPRLNEPAHPRYRTCPYFIRTRLHETTSRLLSASRTPVGELTPTPHFIRPVSIRSDIPAQVATRLASSTRNNFSSCSAHRPGREVRRNSTQQRATPPSSVRTSLLGTTRDLPKRNDFLVKSPLVSAGQHLPPSHRTKRLSFIGLADAGDRPTELRHGTALRFDPPFLDWAALHGIRQDHTAQHNFFCYWPRGRR